MLRRVQLEARETDRIGTLSKGNQQKVQIAAALMGEPMVLLVDEPFSGLDPVNRGLALELFREQVRNGRAVLISTHQLEHVEQLCDRMLLLNRGRTLLSGEVRAVREQFYDGSLLVRGEGDFAALPAVLRVQGERLFLKPGATAEDALRQMLDAGLRLRSFQPALPSLEEIFVKVVAEHEAQAPEAEVA
jgi:ABC-2 type transport system ATP-binding protein